MFLSHLSQSRSSTSKPLFRFTEICLSCFPSLFQPSLRQTSFISRHGCMHLCLDVQILGMYTVSALMFIYVNSELSILIICRESELFLLLAPFSLKRAHDIKKHSTFRLQMLKPYLPLSPYLYYLTSHHFFIFVRQI